MQMSDAILLDRTRADDPEAFGDLVDRHKDAIVNYLTRLVGCRDRAEDLAQETFVRLYQKLADYREEGHLSAYLFRIATNLVASEERRKKRWRTLRQVFLPPPEATEINPEPSPQRQLLSSEIQDQLRSALDELDLTYRAPLVLREIEGLSYREISRALSLSEGTVKSRIHRGREKLKERLAPYWNGDSP